MVLLSDDCRHKGRDDLRNRPRTEISHWGVSVYLLNQIYSLAFCQPIDVFSYRCGSHLAHQVWEADLKAKLSSARYPDQQDKSGLGNERLAPAPSSFPPLRCPLAMVLPGVQYSTHVCQPEVNSGLWIYKNHICSWHILKNVDINKATCTKRLLWVKN